MIDKKHTFPPYVGPHYGKDMQILKKKLLVLGASHYCDGCGDDYSQCSGCDGHFTEGVIRDYLDPTHKANWKRTFSKFINAVFDRNTDLNTRRLFWEDAIFYNYVQEPEGTDANDKHPEKFFDPKRQARDINLLLRLIDKYRPEAMIVWGKNVWNSLPNDIGDGHFTKLTEEVVDLPLEVRNSVFRLDFPTYGVLACASEHPSSSGYTRWINALLYSKLDMVKRI